MSDQISTVRGDIGSSVGKAGSLMLRHDAMSGCSPHRSRQMLIQDAVHFDVFPAAEQGIRFLVSIFRSQSGKSTTVLPKAETAAAPRPRKPC